MINCNEKKIVGIFLAFALLFTFFTTSCGALMQDSGDTHVRISLPPINSQSRSIAGDRLPYLQTATQRYRVTVNGMVREGSESVYEFTLPVGSAANVVVECLNGSGQVIVRAEKSFTVASGDNVFSIVLKNDGNEIINSGVSYSSGVASIGVSDIPAAVNVAAGEKFTVSATPPSWSYGTFDGWKTDVALTGDAGNVQEGGNVNGGDTYTMPNGSVTLTAQWYATPYNIEYVTDNNSQVTATSLGVSGATSFTMENIATSDTLSTYTDNSGNFGLLGWSTIDGANSPNISSIADIRAAVANGSLQIISDATSKVKLYAVWADARTPFDVTVNASALGLGTTTISNVKNGVDIKQQVTDFLTGKANDTVKYELKSGNTFTANTAQPTVTLSDTNVTTKVELQLANKIITATATSPLEQSEVTFTDPGTSDDGFMWYTVGTALPTATVTGSNAQQYEVKSGWRSTDSQVAHTTVSKDTAGKTLYPIGEQKVAVTVTSGSSYPLNGTTTFYASKSADITSQVKACMPTSATTAANGAKKYTWKVADSGVIDAGTGTTKTVDIDQYLTVETAFDVQVRFSNTAIGNAFYAFNGDVITNQIKNVVDSASAAGNLDNGNKRYVWDTANTTAITASSNTTHFYDVDARLKVTAVQLTLSSAAINGPGVSGTFTVSIVPGGSHSNDINKAAWYNIGESFPDVNVLNNGTLENGYEVSWGEDANTTYLQITEALAGKTLKAVLRI